MADYIYPVNVLSTNKMFYWLDLQSLTIGDQKAGPRVPTAAKPGVGDASFKIMIPEEIQISLNHSWEPYNSMTSRIASVLEKYYTAQTQVIGMAKTAIAKGNLNHANWFEGVATKQGQSENVLYTRIDSPLVYKNSTPIEYNLNLKFSAFTIEEALHVHQMIHKLMTLSCPEEKAGDNVRIKPPRLFTVKSYQGTSNSFISLEGLANISTVSREQHNDLLNIKYAAIVQLQPSFQGPFVDGLSLNTSLAVTFRDIEPLFNTSFGTGATVTASSLSAPVVRMSQ